MSKCLVTGMIAFRCSFVHTVSKDRAQVSRSSVTRLGLSTRLSLVSVSIQNADMRETTTALQFYTSQSRKNEKLKRGSKSAEGRCQGVTQPQHTAQHGHWHLARRALGDAHKHTCVTNRTGFNRNELHECPGHWQSN